MKGRYLYYRDVFDNTGIQTGINRKVASQINALNKSGCECEFLFCPQPETVLGMVKSCLPGFSDGVKWPEVSMLEDVDYLYIRRPRFASKELIRFLSGFRQVNQEALVIYEVPTYPYDKEMFSPKMRFALAKDRRYRQSLKRYVDYVADLSGESSIFEIPTVQITNGIDLSEVSVKSSDVKSDRIDVISVAFFEFWHGLDRFIEGLHRYYRKGGTRQIHLHLVGGGSQLSSLKKLCCRLGLEDRVTFYGVLKQDEIRSVYDKCSFAVECLGIHRRGTGLKSASLKSREYLAKGIPFMYSAEIDIFEKYSADFCLKVPECDEPVDIEKFVCFYDKLYFDSRCETVVDQIREYAENTISMEKVMRNVIELLLTKQNSGMAVEENCSCV